MIELSRLGREWRDFTRRNIDRRRSVATQEFRVLFEAAPAALVVVLPNAPTFTVIAASDSYLRVTLTVRDGPSGIVGRGLFEVFPDIPAHLDGAQEQSLGSTTLHASITRCIATGAPDALPVQRYVIPRRDGTLQECFWRLVNSPVLEPKTGRVTCVIHSIEDVTVLQQSLMRTIEAEHATAIAMEANAVKTRFLAAMSHELRTPLNAIAGYVDLLAMGIQGPVTPAQCDALDRVRRAEKHLLGVINEVLTYAKLEAGRLELSHGPVPISRVLADVEGFVTPLARAKGIELSFRLALPTTECLLTTYGDEEKLRQVIINLVSNAIKFTSAPGKVSVSCAADGAEHVVVRVSDTGVGIAESDLERIFEPFVQVGRTLSSAGGTGLGLPISRELARAMGGDVTVESHVGAGSTFALLLPRVDVDGRAPRAA